MPRITDLTSASTVALTDTLVLVQSGTTKKCDVSQVKTLSASELTSGTLGTARLPVVPVVNGGTGSTNATDALAALNAQPALTSASPLAILGGGTGATTAAAALSNLGGVTSAGVPALVTAQLSAYTPLTTSAAFQNSAQVRALASTQIAAITPASIGALAVSQASGFATTAQVVGIANTSQLAGLQNSAQVRALTTAQLNAISINSGSGLTGGGTIDTSRTIALQTSGVVSNVYGSNSTIPIINVDAFGRITGATSTPISSSAGGTVTSVGATSSTLAISNSPILFSGALQIELATTGVAAITAGSSTQSAVITVDAYGRVTNLQNVPTAGGGGASGVTPGTYGSASTVPSIAINTNGVITGATNQALSISIAQVGSLGANVSTFLQTPSSANLAAALTDETGTGLNVFATSPTIATPTINGYTEGTVAVGTVGATATLAITAGTVLTATLTSATPCTFTMPGAAAGKSFVLYLRQPASGTATTATFTGVKWSSGAPPVITAALGRLDIISFASDGVNWYGSIIQDFIY